MNLTRNPNQILTGLLCLAANDGTPNASPGPSFPDFVESDFAINENGVDDFSEEMLKQYLREEERRAQHQASLIKLREKALKDKAKAEMEYLDQLKAQSKGDPDKMSTIRKRQRAVVIKLQEEQVR